MPGLLHHNAMPEDREELPQRPIVPRGAASAPVGRAAIDRRDAAAGGPAHLLRQGQRAPAPTAEEAPADPTRPDATGGGPRRDVCSALSDLAPEHEWEDVASGGKRCVHCHLIFYPQRSLF